MYRDLEPGTNLRDWVVWLVRAGCWSWAALSSNDSKTRYKHYIFSGSVQRHFTELSVPERSEGTEVMKTAIRAAIVFWRRKDFGGAE